MGTTMRDTTIRSHFGKKLKIGYRGNGTVQIECGPDHDNTGNHVRIYKLDELKAALGAVSTADMAREIGEEVARRKAAEAERDEYRMAAEAEAEGLNEWQARAERATEALAASQERCDEHVQEASERAEVAQAKAVALAAERDHWKARAEKAEAALVKIIEWWDSDEEGGALGDILRPLRPKPAFALPTEVPARIEAKRVHHGYTTILTLFTDGAERFWRAEFNGEDWTDAGVMECFTDHRVLGDDQ